jgi:hypothetical protein
MASVGASVALVQGASRAVDSASAPLTEIF